MSDITTDSTYGAIAPVIPQMTATGTVDSSGSYVFQEQVTIFDVDFMFTTTLNTDENVAKLLNAFTVTATYDASGVSGVGYDATLTATINNSSTGFLDAIQAGLNGATSASGSINDVLSATAFTELRQKSSILNSLMMMDDAVNQLLADIDITDITVTINTENGASNLRTSIYNSGSDNYATQILQQIPASSISHYQDSSENLTTGALPFARGDKITFVWDVLLTQLTTDTNTKNSNTDITGDVSNNWTVPGYGGVSGASPSGTGAYSNTANIVSSAVIPGYASGSFMKRIAVTYVLDGTTGSGAFPVSTENTGETEANIESKLKMYNSE